MRAERLNSLTSLRAFAALGVFFSHMAVIQNSSNRDFASSFEYFKLGYSGVTFFFILSGFILTYSFTISLRNGNGSFVDFLAHRVFRIYPVHLLCLTVFIVGHSILGGGFSPNILSIIKNALLIQSYSVDKEDYFSFNAVSWSISVEMFFYVSFCFIIFARKRMLALFAALILINVIYMASYGEISDAFSHWFFYINPFNRLPDFLIGIILCKLYFEFKSKPSYLVLSFAEISSVVFILMSVYMVAKSQNSNGLQYDALFIPSMAFSILVFSFNGGIISKIISNKVMILLGDASFSFYLVHTIVISTLSKFFNVSGLGAISVIKFIVMALFASLFISIMMYLFFEKPINNKLRKWWSGFKNDVSTTRVEKIEGDQL
ncbi:acyltransferase family protein [Escherichia coli]|uniref:acyltransferase family protein n=1 Tax=Escherichia coli TaxID=562 RepID=UPI0023B8EC6A|nr:acyltransferase [Escherichia coli]